MDTIWQDIRQDARIMARTPWIMAIAVLVLASQVPTRRATTVDPIIALHQE
jgi:hypothetical protein